MVFFHFIYLVTVEIIPPDIHFLTDNVDIFLIRIVQVDQSYNRDILLINSMTSVNQYILCHLKWWDDTFNHKRSIFSKNLCFLKIDHISWYKLIQHQMFNLIIFNRSWHFKLISDQIQHQNLYSIVDCQVNLYTIVKTLLWLDQLPL